MGLLQQGGLDGSGVPGPIGGWESLDHGRDLRAMLGAELTVGQRRRGRGEHRFQRLAGQPAPGAEAFHRQRSPPALGRGAPQLRADQPGQASIAKNAGGVAGVQFGQHRHLPVPQPGELDLQLGHRSQQLGVCRTADLFVHVFDSTEPSKTATTPVNNQHPYPQSQNST